MASEKILIIDGDTQSLITLEHLFLREGYSVAKAKGATKALASLGIHKPDLIVLDLVLPDTDGYTLLESLKNNMEWRFIPVIVVSSKRKLEDKLKGLRLGVMDYLTKPFEREELLARVRNILDFYQLKTRKTTHTGESNHERMISFMKERGIRSLIPRIRRDAKIGYEYPEAAKVLQPEEPGGEIYILESIAKADLLARIFYDAIHICPDCGHHDLNFREVCPQCSYADIDALRMITHLTCGYRGFEGKFRTQEGFRCPSCFDSLAPISNDLAQAENDFKVSVASLYVCAGCRSKFVEPIVNCRCMNCDKQFDVSEALIRKVYAYKWISDGSDERSPEPPLPREPGEWEDFEKKIKEMKMHFIGMDGFARQLEREISRAQKEGSGVSLISLKFKGLLELGHADHLDASGFVQGVLDAFKRVLRDYDVLSLRDHFEWLVMLPETPFRMAKIVAERLVAALKQLNFEVKLELNMSSYPEDGAHARELLEILDLGIINLQSL